MSKITEFLSGLSEDRIEHQVGERVLTFYEVPFIRLTALRKPLTQLSQAFSVLLTNFDLEVGHHRTEDTNKGINEITVMPKTTDLSIQHSNAKQEAISRLASAILSEETSGALAFLVLCSLRDEFPDKPSHNDAMELRDSVSAPSFVEMVIGAIKANGRIFRPFEKQAAAVGRKIKSKVDNLTSEEREEEQVV